MNINFTLIGQMITFIVFIWFTMRYVWPPITKAMHERQKKIADGLAAGERGKKELELAQHKTVELLREAKLEASHIVEQANKRAMLIVEEAKEDARKQTQQMLANAEREVSQLAGKAKESLRKQVANLVVMGASKIVEKEIDQQAHDKLFDELITEL